MQSHIRVHPIQGRSRQAAWSRKAFILLAGTFLLFAGLSCAGFQKDADTADSKQVTALLEKGDAAGLAKLSASPFLLDREIVAIPADVEAFWAGMAGNGFRFTEAVIDEAGPVDKDTAQDFGSSMDVKNFFKHYVPASARILSFRSGDQKKVVLIVSHEKGVFRIIGFRGPFGL